MDVGILLSCVVDETGVPGGTHQLWMGDLHPAMQMPGIEPGLQQWQVRVSPLHYPGPFLILWKGLSLKMEDPSTAKWIHVAIM